MESYQRSQFSHKPEWFILNDGNHVGPFSGQKIADYFIEGNLNKITSNIICKKINGITP